MELKILSSIKKFLDANDLYSSFEVQIQILAFLGLEPMKLMKNTYVR